MLGVLGAVHGAHNADDLVVTPTPGVRLDEALTAALDAVVASARARGLTWSDRADDGGQEAAPAHRSGEMDGYLRAGTDGTFAKVIDGLTEPHSVPFSQAAELQALLGLRDTVRALLDAEAASPQDTPQISELRPAQGGFRDDPFSPLVYALEEFDPAGQRAAKADIFSRRVIAPRGSARTPPPMHWPSAWTPAARPGWPRSPACSAPARKTPAASSARWYSTTRNPAT